jgi:regulator of protease activity HflC (stomatin/prohibitin superfamily)
MKSIKKTLFIAIIILSVIMVKGCRRPYKKELIREISPSQTAYLIPLEGNSLGNQGKFSSLEFLNKMKVASKRISIAQRWFQEGRKDWDGYWIPSETLIVVERKPETREWTSDSKTGTSKKDEAIEAESKNSIGFKIGTAITAQIEEEDVSTFLYRYNNKPLTSILDEEIRIKIESAFIENCAKRDIADIISNKADILEEVRKNVIPFFKVKGITITNLGYKGQITYSDPKIQTAINKEFIAEKERVAQLKINETIISKTKAEANAKMEAQKAINEMEISKAKAETTAIQERLKTIDSQMKIRFLEILEKAVNKWDGSIPKIMSGNGEGLIKHINLEQFIK